MKVFKLLLTLLFVSLLFTNCEKNPDDITITFNESGSALINVVDKDNNPIPDVNISVGISTYNKLSENISNQDGNAYFGAFLQGTYIANVSIERDGLVYQDTKIFQIMAGKEVYVKLFPFMNVGNVSFKVSKYYLYEDDKYSNYAISLIPYDNWNYPNTISELQKLTVLHKQIDEEGFVEFTGIPAGEYIFCFYNNKNGSDYIMRISQVSVTKGKTSSISFSF